MPKQTLFDITVQLHHETDRAWLVSADGETKVWVPKSVGELEKHPTQMVWTLTAPEWILEDKDLL